MDEKKLFTHFGYNDVLEIIVLYLSISIFCLFILGLHYIYLTDVVTGCS